MSEKVKISIVLATVADIPFIRELAEKVWWDHYPEIISDDQIRFMLDAWYSESALIEQITKLGHQFWLITPEGANSPCGYLAISQKEEPGNFYLHKFYLEGRGRGIGQAAFEEVVALYPNLNEIRLNVNRRNFKSINFYFKMGFRIESVMDLRVSEQYIMDDFVMVRK